LASVSLSPLFSSVIGTPYPPKFVATIPLREVRVEGCFAACCLADSGCCLTSIVCCLSLLQCCLSVIPGSPKKVWKRTQAHRTAPIACRASAGVRCGSCALRSWSRRSPLFDAIYRRFPGTPPRMPLLLKPCSSVCARTFRRGPLPCGASDPATSPTLGISCEKPARTCLVGELVRFYAEGLRQLPPSARPGRPFARFQVRDRSAGHPGPSSKVLLRECGMVP
jgi:hypothetical protein